MKDTDNTFKWNDDLVLEFSRFTNIESNTFQGRYADLDQFKQSKLPPLSKDKERIEVSKIKFQTQDILCSKNYYEFVLSHEISSDKFPAIKQAIESALNEDTVVCDIEEAGIAAVKISEQLNPKLTSREQAIFIAGFQECIKWQKSKTDTVVEDRGETMIVRTDYWKQVHNDLRFLEAELDANQDKVYTQVEVDAIIEATWNAARATNPMSGMKYDTFQDYLQSLTKDKEVDTTYPNTGLNVEYKDGQIQLKSDTGKDSNVVTDNSDVACISLTDLKNNLPAMYLAYQSDLEKIANQKLKTHTP